MYLVSDILRRKGFRYRIRMLALFLLPLAILLTAGGVAGATEWSGGGLTLTSDTLDAGAEFASNVLTIKANGDYTLSGATTTARVVVSPGLDGVNITLDGVDMSASSASTHLFEMKEAVVTLNLAQGKKNIFKSNAYALIHVPEGADLTIIGLGSLEVVNTSITGAAIGSISSENCGKVTIKGGTVKASTGNNAAAIGGGRATGANGGGGGEITITGGVVTATGGTGIGGGGGNNTGVKQNTGGKITITGGVVTATGIGGAGIGGGSGYNSDGDKGGGGGEITITGGVIKAASTSGQGIGTGQNRNGYGSPRAGKITITGGYIDATSINGRLPVGEGTGDFLATGNFIKIGGGEDGVEPLIIVGSIHADAEIAGGIIFKSSEDNGEFYGDAVTLTYGGAIPTSKNLTIPAGKKLTIPEDKTLTIEAGAELINSGTLTNNGKIIRLGTLSPNDGTAGGTGRVIHLPGAPASVGAAARVHEEDGPLAVVTFAAPADNGNVEDPSSLRYTVKCYMKNAEEAFEIVNDKTASNVEIGPVTIPGLVEENFYVFTVTAVNEAGAGPESAKSSPPVSPGAALPEYAASINPAEKVFANAAFGYATVEEQVFTITNIGPNPFTAVTASLNEGAESAFEIVEPLPGDAALESELTVSVRPKSDLSAGGYGGTLRITGTGDGDANSLDLSAALTFTVTKAGQPKPNPPEADTIANNLIRVCLLGANAVNAPNARFAYRRKGGAEWAWQDGLYDGTSYYYEATGLDELAEYEFKVRFKETDNYSPSAESDTRTYTTKATLGGFAGGDTIYDGAIGEGWMYAGDTFTVDSGYAAGSVSFKDDVIVALDGDVTINNDGGGPAINSGGTVTITADEDTSHTLTLTSGEDAAIFADGDITISGPVTVSATGKTAGIRSEEGSVTIAGAAHVTAAGTDTNSDGIDAFKGEVTIDLEYPGTLSAAGKGTGHAITAEEIHFDGVPAGSVTLTNLDAEDDEAVTEGEIDGGDAGNVNYVQKNTVVFVEVTGITGVPDGAVAGADLELTGTVTPDGATHTDIAWSVKSAGATGAQIADGNKLKTTAAGTVTVTATIADGTAPGTDFTEDFEITVTDPSTFVEVTGITGVPTTATAGADLALSGAIAPSNATNKTIVWAVTSAGTTGAVISGGNNLKTTAAGTVTVTATIADGTAPGTDFTEDFEITVYEKIKIPDVISEKVQEEFDAAKDGFEEKGITLIAPEDAHTLNLSGGTLPESVKDLGESVGDFLEVKDGRLVVVDDVIKEEIAKVTALKNIVDATKPIVTHEPVAVTLETRGETVLVPVPVEFGALSSAGAATFGDIVLMKVKRDGSLAVPSMKSELDAISKAGDYVIKDETGVTVSASTELNGSGTYCVYIAITDDGAYDWNKAPKEIFDPLSSGLRADGTGGSGNQTGGGCDSGAFAATAVVMLAAVAAAKKRVK
ncbi:MAG: fibronectin type III domain-containing protein [Synergistaceae bacterium]|jgi:hypothetical protein|nr:fibronectin type III domain-containing protein [Synergistaceae bacterium]